MTGPGAALAQAARYDRRVSEPARLLCDALGGLARWLRAVGHAAWFDPFIDDAAIVARASRTGEVVLTSDAPLLERRAFTQGEVRGLFVPRHEPVEEQLVFVMRTLGLAVLDPRCMACGGELVLQDKAAVREEVPPVSWANHERFYRCAGCGRLFWHGTHWSRIEAKRRRFAERLAK